MKWHNELTMLFIFCVILYFPLGSLMWYDQEMIKHLQLGVVPMVVITLSLMYVAGKLIVCLIDMKQPMWLVMWKVKRRLRKRRLPKVKVQHRIEAPTQQPIITKEIPEIKQEIPQIIPPKPIKLPKIDLD
jgi:hypothetical protein